MGLAAGIGLALTTGRPAHAEVPFDSDAVLGQPTQASGVQSQSATAASTDTGAGTSSAPQVRIGNLGLITQDPPAPAAPDPTGRPYTITPSLGVQLLATDNVYQTSSQRRADLITQVSPGITASADTVRLHGSISYTPQVQIYASNSSQNNVQHIGNGTFLAELVPSLVFLDVRGATAVQSSRGGFQPQGTLVQNREDQVQTTNLQISPYLIKRFGGDATFVAGYDFQYSNQSGDQATLLGSGQPYFTPQSYTANEGQLALSSGENFGRLGFEARGDATAYSGSGVLSGAHRAFATVGGRYAIVRGVAALAEVGYENEAYGGTPRTRISDPTWAVGVRLASAPDTLVIAKYGHRDGFNSASLDAGVSIGPSTRLTANYSDRLETIAQEEQDLLSSAVSDSAGNLVNATTLGPTSYGNSFLSVQGGLFRTRRFNASVAHSWPRDTVTLGAFYERRTVVATTQGVAAFGQSGYTGSVSWTHELQPDTTGIVSIQYGKVTQPGAGNQDSFTFTLGAFKDFGRNLSGYAQYVLTNTGSGPLAYTSGVTGNYYTVGNSLQNVVLVGARKSF